MPGDIGPPVWELPEAASGFPALDGPIEADVVIVGGGLLGLVAGLELLEQGKSVVVAEARWPGAGTSSRNAGHIGPMLYGARKGPDDIVKALGSDRGQRLNRMVAESGAWLLGRIEALGIECDLRKGYLCIVRSKRSFKRVGERFSRWEEDGGKFERVDPESLSDHVRSSRYAGGFLLPEGGFLDPAKLIAGLATAFVSRGGRLFSDTRVLSTTHGVEEGWTCRTPLGRMRSRQLLIAAGASEHSLAPLVSQAVYPVYAGIAATSILPADARSVLPEGGPVADLDDMAVNAPAIDASGRMLMSFLLEGGRPQVDESTRAAKRRLGKMFPRTSFPPFQSFSYGAMTVTPDGLPRLFDIGPNALAISGCNGFGLTLGCVAAREAARSFSGADADGLALPISKPSKLRGRKATPWIIRHIVAPLANRLGA